MTNMVLFEDFATPEDVEEAVASLRPENYDSFFEMEANKTNGEIIDEARKLMKAKERYMSPADLKKKPTTKKKSNSRR